MTQVTLIRKKTNGKAVYGEITFPIGERTFTYPTLENADYLIEPGTYTLERTYSPKYKKLMPLISGVPDRDGLRIHRGTKPEHSTGCVLVDDMAQANIDIMFNYIEKYKEDEKVVIKITDPDGIRA